MNSRAPMHIIRVLIVIIVLLMSIQVVGGAVDTEIGAGQGDDTNTCAKEVDDIEIVINKSSRSVRVAMAYVPTHGPSLDFRAKIGGGSRISFKIGWSRTCGGRIEVEYLSAAIRTDPQGRN